MEEHSSSDANIKPTPKKRKTSTKRVKGEDEVDVKTENPGKHLPAKASCWLAISLPPQLRARADETASVELTRQQGELYKGGNHLLVPSLTQLTDEDPSLV
jgi:hypothetical protein